MIVTLDANLLGPGPHPAMQNGGQAELIRQNEKTAWVQPMPGQPIYEVPAVAIISHPPAPDGFVFPEFPMAEVTTVSEPGV